MFCRNCGKEMSSSAEICVGCGVRPPAGDAFCNSCGAETSALAEMCVKCGTMLGKSKRTRASTDVPTGGVSQKSRLIATLLCALPGYLLAIGGIHRLYLGKIGTGVTMLILSVLGWITVWFLVGFIFFAAVWIWSLVDFIYLVTGKMKDSKGDFVMTW